MENSSPAATDDDFLEELSSQNLEHMHLSSRITDLTGMVIEWFPELLTGDMTSVRLLHLSLYRKIEFLERLLEELRGDIRVGINELSRDIQHLLEDLNEAGGKECFRGVEDFD